MAAPPAVAAAGPIVAAAGEFVYVSSRNPAFRATVNAGAGTSLANNKGYFLGNLDHWITNQAAMPGSSSGDTIAQNQLITPALTRMMNTLQGLTADQRDILISATGRTGATYRKKFMKLWVNNVGAFGDNENTVAMFLLVGLCGMVSSKERLSTALDEIKGTVPIANTVYNFLDRFTTTYVSAATNVLFPLVKISTSLPDLALGPLVKIHEDQFMMFIRGLADTGAAAPAGSTNRVVAASKTRPNGYQQFPAFLKQTFMGHFHLLEAAQREHMEWAVHFWESTVTKSNLVDNNGRPIKYEPGFQLNYYSNTVSDRFLLLESTGNYMTNNPYNWDNVWDCAISYLTA